MRVLSISHMFPNRCAPDQGVFVKERLKALYMITNVEIIAPIPTFPFSSFFKKYKILNTLPKIEDFDGLKIHHPRYFLIPKYFKFLDGYFYYLSTNYFFCRILQRYEFDILDLHWVFPDAFAAILWAKKFKKKIVVTIRGNESISYFEKSLRKKMLIKTLQSVDHIIAVSNDMKKKVVNEYGVSDDKVTVVANGIDTRKFYRTDKEKAVERCRLNGCKKYLLSLCRLSHEKGLEYLLKAFSMITNKGTEYQDIELIFVGDGPLGDKMEAMARELKIKEKIKFIGSVPHEEVVYWFNAADVYCLPSLWEGCPNVIIESLCCGTPVVSTTVGGIPDLVPNDEYGFLVSAGDSRALAGALDAALKKCWNHDKISQYGSRNTWENVADKIVEVFESVIQNK